MVTGIVPSGEIDVAAALRGAGLSLELLTVITAEDASLTDVPETIGRPRSDIMMGTTGTGTGVPGLTSGSRELGARAQPLPAYERLLGRLGHLAIPDDEIQNYVEALEAGRTVVGYAATSETAERVADVLRGAGVAKVKIA